LSLIFDPVSNFYYGRMFNVNVTASVGGSIGEKVVGVVRLFIFAVDWTGVALAQAEKK